MKNARRLFPVLLSLLLLSGLSGCGQESTAGSGASSNTNDSPIQPGALSREALDADNRFFQAANFCIAETENAYYRFLHIVQGV